MSQELAQRISAAARWWLPWPLLLLVLQIRDAPTPAQQAAADPLLLICGAIASLPITAALALAAATFWALRYKVSGRIILQEGLWALAAILLVSVTLLVLHHVNGAVLPGFIPPEESAAPGMTLGLAAGVLEEAMFRLMLLPLLLVLLTRWLPATRAQLIAIAVTALAFTLLHEVHEPQWQPGHLVTRFVLPGVVMSLIFIRISPSALLSGHCFAHVLIPGLFLPPTTMP